MITEYNHTIVKTILRQVPGNTKKWRIMLEAYPVYQESGGDPTRVFENPNITVTTPIFETTPSKVCSDGKKVFAVKRNADGVIMCKSRTDMAACAYADEIRKLRQEQYDREKLYTREEKKIVTRFEKGEENFIDYFEEGIVRLHPNGSKGVLNNWRRTLELFKRFTGNRPVSFKEIDAKLCNDFKYYVMGLTKEVNHNGLGQLSEGTVAQYISVFKAVLKQAFVEDFLSVNVSAQFKGVSPPQSKRDTLDMEEVNLLGRTQCDRPVVKRAALFTVLTGLRHCDVKALKWGQVQNASDGWRIDFVQKKTGIPEYLPISDQAYSLFGEPKDDNQLIFSGLPAVSECNRTIVKWLKAAGIDRHITYHCFRHTNATLLLQKGVDLFTIKTMLGHTRVTTTEIYGHIVDSTKRKAAKAIDLSAAKDKAKKNGKK